MALIFVLFVCVLSSCTVAFNVTNTQAKEASDVVDSDSSSKNKATLKGLP
jgi:hypothetical protein